MMRPGREQHAADVGLAGEDALAADDFGQDVLVAEAVLQRQHDGVARRQATWPPAIASRVWKDLTSTMTRSTGPIAAASVAAWTRTATLAVAVASTSAARSRSSRPRAPAIG